MKKNLDKLWVGLLFRIIVPLFVMLIFYYSSYAYLTVPEFLRRMVFAAIIFKVLSLCAVANLGVFFLFYKTENDRAARGVIFATMIFAILTMINQAIEGGLF